MLTQVQSPQLRLLHRGKVRDSFRIDSARRLIVVTDRISAFDLKLKTPIARKGELLNRISGFWMEAMKDVIENHLLEEVDPQAVIVRECVPVRVEMIVRGYISGSLWRSYLAGRREMSGVTLPDGLTANARLPEPIVTPTTKEESDREITPAEIVSSGLCTRPVYDRMAEAAREIFAKGTRIAAERGLLLADTKLEFGMSGNELLMIDECLTPDSSRFWDEATYAVDPATVTSYDKEFVRQWMKAHSKGEELPTVLPDDVARETSRRYLALHERLTGRPVPESPFEPRERLYRNLVSRGVIKDGYVAIIMGSKGDLPWCQRIEKTVRAFGVGVDLRVMSAHKNGERIREVASEYNDSIEPGTVIAVAGESNGLGGALAANLNLPVINCPPFEDAADYEINVHSSLRMPSLAPASTTLGPELAARAAMRALNLRRLREAFSAEIGETKKKLINDDAEVRAGSREVGS
ncbi:MAG: phosphoribosylaminoimidazolesuccinocarboxamide synthase [Deltaproteobacteria bacterium]|nr:phosphoribosylaminoimidazolesuccinocarboxamide synthase [Deltaproteobacteria bacterium]